MVTPVEHELTASDGVRLFVRDWLPPDNKSPTALVVIVHGLGEHAGRYQHVAEVLVDQGYAVRGADHRGHGRSGGLRGHVDDFAVYRDDLHRLTTHLREAHEEDLPCFVLGHSMGGLLTLDYLRDHLESGLSGAVLSNPCLAVAVKAPVVKVAAGKLLSRVLPRLRLDNELDTSLLCRDPEAVRAYEQDPLVHRKISTRLYTSLVAAMDRVGRAESTIKLPTLWLIGDQDKICDPQASLAFVGQLDSTEVETHRWPQAFHEIHNGPDKIEFVTAVGTWLESKTAEAR